MRHGLHEQIRSNSILTVLLASSSGTSMLRVQKCGRRPCLNCAEASLSIEELTRILTPSAVSKVTSLLHGSLLKKSFFASSLRHSELAKDPSTDVVD